LLGESKRKVDRKRKRRGADSDSQSRKKAKKTTSYEEKKKKKSFHLGGGEESASEHHRKVDLREGEENKNVGAKNTDCWSISRRGKANKKKGSNWRQRQRPKKESPWMQKELRFLGNGSLNRRIGVFGKKKNPQKTRSKGRKDPCLAFWGKKNENPSQGEKKRN